MCDSKDPATKFDPHLLCKMYGAREEILKYPHKISFEIYPSSPYRIICLDPENLCPVLAAAMSGLIKSGIISRNPRILLTIKSDRTESMISVIPQKQSLEESYHIH